MALFAACSGGSSGGDGAATNACDVVGTSEACSCAGGGMGMRACGDDMTFGACLGCPDVDPAMVFDGRCFRCLDDDPYAVVCEPNDTVDRSAGKIACADGSSVNACSTLAGCCEAFRRTAGTAGTCGGCLSRFTGVNCDQCADGRFVGANCDQCAERFMGADCDQCADGRFVGANCDQCAEGFVGADCDQCADARFVGAGCDIEFIRIEGGTFQMGGDGMFDGRPIHDVAVPSFEMSKTEVTVGQYRACVNAGSCTKPSDNWDDEPVDRENHPVANVDWNQAKAFAEFAGARLPSEAEWEYTARSGRSDNIYPWGNEEPNCDRLNFNDCVRHTRSVCSYAKGNTEQGLCDMAGNVWEWVADDWHDTFDGAPNDGSAWVETPRASYRVGRGGAWRDDEDVVRATSRYHSAPSSGFDFLGFRLARSLPGN